MAKPTQKDLMKILKAHRRELLSLRGVHHIDIGFKYKNSKRTDELAIRIHVYNKRSKAILKSETIPKRLAGVKTDVVVSNPVKNSRFDRAFETIVGGIEIQNIYLADRGTLGGIFQDETGYPVGLTNHHVIVGSRGQIGDEIVQPYKASPRNIDIIGTAFRAKAELDCAIFRLNNRRQYDADIFQLTQLISEFATRPQIGDSVVKSGVATDVTCGIIDGISDKGIFKITKNDRKPNRDNIISGIGDSGSIWIMDKRGLNEGLGLHYRGEIDGSAAFCVSLRLVMNAMGITFLKP